MEPFCVSCWLVVNCLKSYRPLHNFLQKVKSFLCKEGLTGFIRVGVVAWLSPLLSSWLKMFSVLVIVFILAHKEEERGGGSWFGSLKGWKTVMIKRGVVYWSLQEGSCPMTFYSPFSFSTCQDLSGIPVVLTGIS